MQIRLPLILLLALTACAPVTPQPKPTTAPTSPKSSLPSSESSTAAANDNTPQYETSVLAALWDAKTRAHQILPVEPSSGEAVPGYAPIVVGVNYYYTYSPNRKTLVVVGYRSEFSSDPVLHVIDLNSWHETKIPLDGKGWTGGLAFSPDGSSVAIGLNDNESALLVVDAEKNRVLAQIEPGFEISRLKFTSDSSAVMAYGKVIVNRFTANEQTSGFAKAALFDARDLNLLWSAELKGVREGIYPADEETAGTTALHENPEAAIYLYPGLVFAPDRDNLYVVHADEDKLTTVDFGSRSVNTVGVRPKLSWLERIFLLTTGVAHAKVANGTSRSAVISPDGTTIYTIGYRNESSQFSNGEWTFTQTPLGLQAIDAGDGTERVNLEISAAGLWITPDGSSLLLHNWNEPPSTDVLNARTLRITGHFDNTTLVPARRMNGTTLLLSSVTIENNRTQMSAYSMDGELLGEWLADGYGAWLLAP